MKLYEISESMEKVLNNLPENPTPEEVEKFQKEYLELDGKLHDKVDDTVKYMRWLETNISAIDEEIARLNKLKSPLTNKVDRLKWYIKTAMDIAGHEKIETSICKVWYKDSEYVDLYDESILPSQFFKEKVTKSVSKSDIKKAIKDGNDVPGAALGKRRNIQIN